MRSDQAQLWLAVVALSLLAILSSQFGLEFFYGTELFLGSGVVVLSLLLLGDRGVVVGLSACMLVPRLWGEPMTLLIALAELLWLKLYLDHVGDPSRRRDNGWIVLADILYWVLIGVPLAFLLFGVVLNLDPGSVLNLAIRQGVNGSLNAIFAFLLYCIIRLGQAWRDQERSMAIHGVLLITLLAAVVLPSLLVLTISTRQLNAYTLETNLRRMRQTGQISAAFQTALLPEFNAGLRRMGAPQDFRLRDARGADVYSSNPGLFRTLETSYVPLPKQHIGWPWMPPQLDLLVPRESLASPRAVLRGYWQTSLTAQELSDLEPLQTQPDLKVQVVQPASARIRELESQSAKALGMLGWILLVGACAAEVGAWALEDQIPMLPIAGSSAKEPSWDGSAQPGSGRKLLRELDSLQLLLENRTAQTQALAKDLRCSEQQRLKLQREVESLSILDPLTGCFNRHELHRRLEHEVRSCKRDQGELSLVCIEIDHLRQINDSYGCPLGDQVLRLVAAEICKRSRTTDCVCRFAEDRFALLLPACMPSSAERLAGLFSRAVADQEVEHEGCRISVTLSVGIAAMRGDRDDGDSLINRAENALYRAKVEGRNRIVLL